jgi:hypothetical protein
LQNAQSELKSLQAKKSSATRLADEARKNGDNEKAALYDTKAAALTP